MAIVFVSGINDRSVVGAAIDEKGQLVSLLDGNCSVHGRVPLKPGVDAWVTLFGKGVKQPLFRFSQQVSLIFNQISDADTHRGALERCVELCAQAKVPVLNHPSRVLQTTRDQVSARLQGIEGVTMPRTVRFSPRSPADVFALAEREEFAMPFIARVAGDHGGKRMLRVDGDADIDALHAFPFDGRDFYLTEFVDCSDADGFFHRQRLVVIDGAPVLRGSLYDQNWMVHGASRSFMLRRESWEDDARRSRWLESELIPPLLPAIREITRRLGLEYYGIDCSLDPDGGMVVFEANANMNILTNDHPELNARMQGIERRIQDMLARHSGEAVI